MSMAVLTGCLRIAEESIFTGLNNLSIKTITDTDYDECFGFTDEEMDELKNRLVGDNNNLLYDECVQIAKQRMERFK